MEPAVYLRTLNTQLTYLFAFAGRINEIDIAAATSAESRGAQDAGWNTAETAHQVFAELKTLGSKGEPLSRPELRQVLSLYAQLAEAGGVYEGLLNTMLIAQLKPWNMWPFQDLVRVRQAPRAVIGPNANAMFRRLAEVATAIGMPGLARVLELAFRDDIRNGMAHADYILAPNGLRLRRRNGGQPIVLSLEQVTAALQIALWFFELLQEFQHRVREGYRPAKTVIGRFSANPPMPWTIEFAENGIFSISTDAPGPQVDAAYERQAMINDRLGGKMMAAYLKPESEISPALQAAIVDAGFEPLVVAFPDGEQFEALVAEVDGNGLWAPLSGPEAAEDAFLMATPFGFRWIATAEALSAWLPAVDEIDIAQ
nr:hypothetical protein [Brevundimonas naejangsanensis]